MIRCTFPDGTTEERPATGPALLNPVDPLDIHARDPRKVGPSQLGFLRDLTGTGNVWIWCLTGEAAGALTGEWRKCHAETSAEQIERLTRERDAAIAALRKIASHPARMRWSPDKQTSVDADGEPWLHWAEIARMALEGT